MKVKLRLRVDGEKDGKPVKGYTCTTVQTHLSTEAVMHMGETMSDNDMVSMVAISVLENFARELRTDAATEAVVDAIKDMLKQGVLGEEAA
jgi:hypothetical protein